MIPILIYDYNTKYVRKEVQTARAREKLPFAMEIWCLISTWKIKVFIKGGTQPLHWSKCRRGNLEETNPIFLVKFYQYTEFKAWECLKYVKPCSLNLALNAYLNIYPIKDKQISTTNPTILGKVKLKCPKN